MSSELDNEDELRRYLMLISYSGMGVDEQLDSLLNELRKAIKSKAEIAEIKSCVDGVTDCLRNLEEDVATVETND